MQEQWIREGQGFLLVYSITSKSTLDHVCSLREKVIRTKNSAKVPMVLVGNKCDLENERAISTEDGQALATKWGIPFFECSAKKRINHEECFYQVVREIRRLKSEATIKAKVKKPLFRCSIL
jgi:GTPase KRas protein